MATRMQQRRGTAAEWTAADPVLAAGEIGYETDTGKFKFGDGTNTWSNLQAFADASAIIGAAPETLNTLEELATAIGNDPSFYADMTLVATAVDQVEADLTAAVTTLNGSISDTLTAANGYTDTAVAAVQLDVDDAQASITILQTDVLSNTEDIAGLVTTSSTNASNIVDIQSDISTIETNLTAEETARIAGDAALDSDIQTLQGSLTDEITNRSDEDTALGLLISALESDLTTEESARIAADTALASDATAKANSAQAAAETTASGYVSTHNSTTLNVHGIADTSVLATDTDVSNAVSTHNSATTSVHGIADTSVLATTTDVSTAQAAAEGTASGYVSTHNSATTSVHGIADTADLALLSAASQTLSGDLTIAGSLTVQGTTTTVSATDLVVADPLIYIGEGNTGNAVDLGVVSSFDDGTYQHAGIVRDASAGIWKIFKGVTDEPTTTINFAQGSLDDLAVNNIEVSGVVFTDGTQTLAGVPSITSIASKTASYTLTAATERDTIIEVDSASATTITVPTDAAVNFPVGSTLDIIQVGAGQVTIAGDTGVTVNGTPGTKLRTQWSSVTLLKRAANNWLVFGDTAA